ncbi:phage late control D family protein [Limnobaculum xujianqingii]|uniref:phage late control D family protein n=1 Tax=Limnobaculum xujianqingii TaxID=2738837 RepID=UPI001128CCC8|nr:phage late control D family protein [Limnobaculum xujianqingii]
MLIDNDYSPVPAFEILIDGEESTALNSRLISLSLIDNREFEADTLELTLDDTDGKVELPPRGAKLSLSLGWNNRPLVFKGIYTVDEVAHRGPPDQVIISAKSADFRQTFNVKRDHSWHDIKVGDVVAAIASRYELQAGVSEELALIEIDHADQTNESDISFLTRMAKMMGAVATIKNGMILFIVPGRGVSQSGKPLPLITIARTSGDRHNFRVADRDAYTGVSAYWLDLNFGKPQKVSIKRKSKTPSQDKNKSTSKEGNYMAGEEGNVFVMRRTYTTEKAAKRAAAAKWAELQRGAAVFSINLDRGRPELFPDQPAVVTGFKSTIDSGEWTITRCVHDIGTGGFTTSLELEVRLADWGEVAE